MKAVPLYEFSCAGCGRRVEVFTRSFHAAVDPSCPHCGRRDLRRRVSRFAFHRSESDLYGDMAPLLDADVDENDPEAMAHWAQKMKDRLGPDVSPEIDELIREGASAMADPPEDHAGDGAEAPDDF